MHISVFIKVVPYQYLIKAFVCYIHYFAIAKNNKNLVCIMYN